MPGEAHHVLSTLLTQRNLYRLNQEGLEIAVSIPMDGEICSLDPTFAMSRWSKVVGQCSPTKLGALLQDFTSTDVTWTPCQTHTMLTHVGELHLLLTPLCLLNACAASMTQHGNIEVYHFQDLIMESETRCKKQCGCNQVTD